MTFRIQKIRKGALPPCTASAVQCRGCYGWENMIAAARRHARWRAHPVGCSCTGLVVRVVAGGDPPDKGKKP